MKNSCQQSAISNQLGIGSEVVPKTECTRVDDVVATSSRMLKQAVQQGRSKRGGESYYGTLGLGVTRERSWWAVSASGLMS